MSEVQIAPGITMKAGGNTDLPPNGAAVSQVILWDVGPEKPVPPKRPPAPKAGKEGDPEYDLAKIEFKDQLEDYEQALRNHKRRKEEHAAWHKRHGGPIELPFWSCDAVDALASDEAAVQDGRQAERRYYVSSRTRGHEKLPNRGLPEGKKPGHGQSELERRIREGDSDLATALAADPVFGKQELRA